MDAIRKQASRLREQVARQQQVKIFLLPFCLDPVSLIFPDFVFVISWFHWFLVNQTIML